MSGGNQAQMSSTSNDAVPFQIVSKPSTIIKTFRKIITIDGQSYELILVTMQRSFMLVVKNCNSNLLPNFPALNQKDDGEVAMSEEMLVQSFMNENLPLKGLSLAIGGHSTCLVASENPLASTSLASRLSKKFNLNRPVYVANDTQTPDDLCELNDLTSKLYLKIFQFVEANYHIDQTVQDKTSSGDQ